MRSILSVAALLLSITSASAQRSADALTVAIGEDFRSYGFDEAWEMLPGRWTFEFHHAGRKIGEKSFDVSTQCAIT